MIPRQVVEEILSRTNIRQLIGRYVTLQRAGSNFKGLCPFHSEKTPSFTVFPSENSFYCFGCGAGGDAITFVRRAENLDYVQAVEYLAKEAGIRIPEQPDRYGTVPKYDRNRLYSMNRDAARYFHACLYNKSEEAGAAYSYLHQKRALSDATIKHFGLGYAPRAYGSFSRYMNGLGYTVDELVLGNLCGRDAQSGRVYDSFYNRVMFPIIDVSGNVIAFGGRVMDDSTPKYKNSSDTPIYNKRRNVYALNYAKDTCSEELILCEGYMDVIALHAAGFTNAVATLGTAITQEHARLMKRYTKRVLISYDMDDAGRNAADKAMRLLEEVGLEVKLLKMDGAKDPDEFIRKFGQERFKQVLKDSDSKFDYNMKRILDKYLLTRPQDRIDAARELCNMIATVPSAAERDVYCRATAEKLQMTFDSIRHDVDRYRSKLVQDGKKREVLAVRQSSLGFSDRVNTDYVKMPAVARCEEAVLGLLLMSPEHLRAVRDGKTALTEEDFLTEFNRRVFQALIAEPEADAEDPFSAFSVEEMGRITRMRVERSGLSENGEAVFSDCVNNLKKAAEKQRQISDGVSIDSLNNSMRL